MITREVKIGNVSIGGEQIVDALQDQFDGGRSLNL